MFSGSQNETQKMKWNSNNAVVRISLRRQNTVKIPSDVKIHAFLNK